MSTTRAIAAGTYALDTAGSTIDLRSKAMWGLATVTGTLTPTSGAAEVRGDGIASGTVTIDAGMLRGPATMTATLRFTRA